MNSQKHARAGDSPTTPASAPRSAKDAIRCLGWATDCAATSAGISAGLCLALALSPAAIRAADAVSVAAAAVVDQVPAATSPPESPAGWRIAPGLTLAGWATLQFELPQRAAASLPSPAGDAVDHDGGGRESHDSQYTRRSRVGISHLAAILWWDPAPNWKLLAEVDSQDLLQLPAHHVDDDGPASAPYLALERLYVDYRAADAVNFRVGKFLTPVGRWNQDHADPLTWTTLRPLISQSAFPTNATGLMIFGNLAWGQQGVDYQLFAAGTTDWRSSPRIAPFDHALGVRVVAPLSPDLQIGLSSAEFVQRASASDRFNLSGVDAVWNWRGAEFSAEAIVRRGSDAEDSGERGGFVQAALPLALGWSVVTRIEAYKRSEDPRANRSALIGVVYRSGRHWVCKAEWVWPSRASQGLPQGLLASLTLLF
jgi:hypothetical protein